VQIKRYSANKRSDIYADEQKKEKEKNLILYYLTFQEEQQLH
jgi:hypothetical protein